MGAPQVKVKLRDQEWVFDVKMTLAEAFALKQAMGLTPQEFLRGQADMDPSAIQALIWLCRRRAGENIRPDEVDLEFDLFGDEFSMEDVSPPTQEDETSSKSDGTD